MQPQGIPFQKVHAAGNDFVLLESTPPAHLIADICDRRYGVGADGVLVARVQDQILTLNHYDPDGGRTFCLNGVISTLDLFHKAGRIPATGKVHSEGMDLDYRVDQRVGVFLPKRKYQALTWQGSGHKIQGFGVDAGNPQFIIHQQLTPQEFVTLAPIIRNDFQTFPEGVNVMHTTPVDQGIRIRAYERGVETFTHACGSGMYAAAVVLLDQGHQETVTFIPDGRGSISVSTYEDRLLMRADATHVFSGVYSCS